MFDEEWIIIDTETTGLVMPIYSLEIAAQKMKGLTPVGEHFRIFLDHNIDIPIEAQKIHGYTRKFLSDNGYSPMKAYDLFFEYINGCSVSSFNLPYDYDQVLIPEINRLKISTPLRRGFCFLRLTQKIISPSPIGNYKLQNLRSYFNLPERDAHSAIGDVLTVQDLLKSVLMPILGELNLKNADEISKYLDEYGYPDHLPFGKHKGRHWNEAKSDLEMRSWIYWLSDKGDLESRKMANWYLDRIQNFDEFSDKNHEREKRKIFTRCKYCFMAISVQEDGKQKIQCQSCLRPN